MNTVSSRGSRSDYRPCERPPRQVLRTPETERAREARCVSLPERRPSGRLRVHGLARESPPPSQDDPTPTCSTGAETAKGRLGGNGDACGMRGSRRPDGLCRCRHPHQHQYHRRSGRPLTYRHLPGSGARSSSGYAPGGRGRPQDVPSCASTQTRLGTIPRATPPFRLMGSGRRCSTRRNWPRGERARAPTRDAPTPRGVPACAGTTRGAQGRRGMRGARSWGSAGPARR